MTMRGRFAAWADAIERGFRRVEARVLPPVLEPGTMPWFSLMYLLFPWMPLFMPSGFPYTDYALTVVACLLFLPLYFGFYWVRGWRRIGILLAIGAVGTALAPANLFANAFVIYASVMATFLPVAWLFAVFAAVQGTYAFAIWSLDLPVGLFLVTSLMTGALAALCNWFWIANVRRNQALRLTQDEVRRLAQLAERERIGRDLHDLLGHTLSVIAIKSELASKLMGRDPAAAQREIDDVERIAREALGQVRRAVAGMRAVGLRAEFANARLALAAVEVDFEYRSPELALHPETETVLAMVLREATTNVIRHSGARRCRAQLARVDQDLELQIHDDGRGGASESGNGMRGMRERSEAIGGVLEVRSSAGEGTTLVLRVPYREPPAPDVGPTEPDARPRLSVVR